DLRLRPTFEPGRLGVRLGGSDAGPLRALRARDHGLRIRGRRLHGRGEQLLLLAVGLELRQLGLLADDLLLSLRLGERPGLVRTGLRRRHLGLRFGLAQRNVARGVDLYLLGLRLSDRRLLVGRGLRHARVPRNRRHALLPEQFYVVRLIGKALDGKGVDLQAARGQVAFGRVLHLLQQLLTVADELLDRQRAHDRAQRAFEDVLDNGVHLLGLGVEESLRRVAQGFDVASDLEGGHALHLDFDALARDRVRELNADLARGELQATDAIDQGHDEGPAADNDLHALVPALGDSLAALIADLGAAGAGHDQGLVRARHVVAAGNEG